MYRVVCITETMARGGEICSDREHKVRSPLPNLGQKNRSVWGKPTLPSK